VTEERRTASASVWRFGLLAAGSAAATSTLVPALPSIAADLGLGEAATAGVLSAYIVPYAATVIVAGQVCDLRGPRVVLRWALVLAIIGALGGALATGAGPLLVARAVQGIGCGAVTMAAYDVARRVPGGIPGIAALLTLGASIGPLLGGLLTSFVGWQLAVALPGLLHLTGVGLRTTDEPGGGRGLDAPGLVLTGAGAMAGAAGLQLARVLPSVALPLGGVGALLLGAALWRVLQRGGRVPPAALVTVPRLRRNAALAMCIAATYFASLVVVPVRLGAAGYDAVAIGALLLPGAVIGATSARRSDRTAAALGRWTEPVAATITLVVLLAIVLLPPVAAALVTTGLAASYGTIQPRLLADIAGEVDDGPATGIGAANLVLLLGGGIGSATIGGLGTARGAVVLGVVISSVLLLHLRTALTRSAVGR
jgi:MFS family permease